MAGGATVMNLFMRSSRGAELCIGISAVLTGFSGIPGDSLGFSGISEGSLRDSEGFLEFLGILRDSD